MDQLKIPDAVLQRIVKAKVRGLLFDGPTKQALSRVVARHRASGQGRSIGLARGRDCVCVLPDHCVNRFAYVLVWLFAHMCTLDT